MARYGGDAVGLILGLTEGGIRKGLTKERAKAISASLPPFVSSVLVTTLPGADEILDLVKYVGTTTIQLHGQVPVAEIRQLKINVPATKLIKTIHVTGTQKEILREIDQITPFVDAILLDSLDRDTGRVGGTGIATDWRTSRQIVKACSLPVILAGGLKPETVCDAIETVRPWGVDVQTGVEDPDKQDGSKSHQLVRAFITCAKRTLPA